MALDSLWCGWWILQRWFSRHIHVRTTITVTGKPANINIYNNSFIADWSIWQTESVLSTCFFCGQICNFWLLSTPSALFTFEKRPNKIRSSLAFFGQLHFLCRFGDFEMILADFWVPEMNGFRFFKSKSNPTISFQNPNSTNWRFQILFKCKSISVVFCWWQNNSSTVLAWWGEIDSSNK